MIFRRHGLFAALACLLAGCGGDDSQPLAELVIVADRDIQGVTVTSSKDVIAVGEAITLAARDSVSNEDIADELRWRSSDESVARVVGAGVVTGVADGTAVISAAIGTLEGSVMLSVSSAGLLDIAVTGVVAAVDVCTSAQFTATGTFADGRVDDLTGSVTWQSSDPTLAAFDTTTAGLLNTVGDGTVDVDASEEGVTSPALPVVISDSLTGITIDVASTSLEVGSTAQLSAQGDYGGVTSDITANADFSSATTSVATIDSDGGLLTAVAEGTSVVSATCNELSGDATFTVTTSTGLASLVDLETVDPLPINVELNTTRQLEVRAEFSDLTTQIVTEDAEWSILSGSPNVLTVSNTLGSKGLVTAVLLGNTNVRVVYDGEELIIPVMVTP